MTHISQFDLFETAEYTLINRGDEDLILALMKRDCFSDSSEKLMIELCNNNQISENVLMVYIS